MHLLNVVFNWVLKGHVTVITRHTVIYYKCKCIHNTPHYEFPTTKHRFDAWRSRGTCGSHHCHRQGHMLFSHKSSGFSEIQAYGKNLDSVALSSGEVRYKSRKSLRRRIPLNRSAVVDLVYFEGLDACMHSSINKTVYSIL